MSIRNVKQAWIDEAVMSYEKLRRQFEYNEVMSPLDIKSQRNRVHEYLNFVRHNKRADVIGVDETEYRSVMGLRK